MCYHHVEGYLDSGARGDLSSALHTSTHNLPKCELLSHPVRTTRPSARMGARAAEGDAVHVMHVERKTMILPPYLESTVIAKNDTQYRTYLDDM